MDPTVQVMQILFVLSGQMWNVQCLSGGPSMFWPRFAPNCFLLNQLPSQMTKKTLCHGIYKIERKISRIDSHKICLCARSIVSGRPVSPKSAARHIASIMDIAFKTGLASSVDGGTKGLLLDYSDLMGSPLGLTIVLEYLNIRFSQEDLDKAQKLRTVSNAYGINANHLLICFVRLM